MGGKIEYYDGAQWVTAGPNVKGKLQAVKIVPEKDAQNNPTGSVIAEIDENAILPGTQAITIPAGSTAERPNNPILGMVRINKDLVTLVLNTTGLNPPPNALDAAVNPSVVDKLNAALGTYTLTHVDTAFTLTPPSGTAQTITVTSASSVSTLDFTALGVTLKWSNPQNLSAMGTATVVLEQTLLFAR